jgi:NADH-ubiquinone oxidoreductase chain 6
MDMIIGLDGLKFILTSLAVISAIFVISTKNAVISVFNLIVLYILVAFYLMYIGITYLGISYLIVYIGAIAILFLFVIMMIDIEVIETKNNNYLPLLFMLLLSFVVVLKNILYSLGVIKVNNKKNLFSQSDLLIKNEDVELFNIKDLNSIIVSESMNKDINNYELYLDNFVLSKDNETLKHSNLLYNDVPNINDNSS